MMQGLRSEVRAHGQLPAMRGLRPLAEIQYLDYLYYALQIMRDDLATVHYRSAGTQRAPLIVRTRGHRLEGIWHAGSPMGAIIHSIRGMHVCVPPRCAAHEEAGTAGDPSRKRDRTVAFGRQL